MLTILRLPFPHCPLRWLDQVLIVVGDLEFLFRPVVSWVELCSAFQPGQQRLCQFCRDRLGRSGSGFQPA
jgi:hypothetical protein